MLCLHLASELWSLEMCEALCEWTRDLEDGVHLRAVAEQLCVCLDEPGAAQEAAGMCMLMLALLRRAVERREHVGMGISFSSLV